VSTRLAPRARPPLPSREERAEALAQALGTDSLKTAKPSRPPPSRRRGSRPPSPSRPPAPQAFAAPHSAAPDRIEPLAAPLGAAGRAAEERERTNPAIPVVMPSHSSGYPAAGNSPSEPTGPIFPLSRRSGEAASSPSSSMRLPALDDSPDISVAATETEWSPEDDALVVGLPDSQIVVAATVPVKPHNSAELRLPTVILNIEGDMEGLVRGVLADDEKAINTISRMGASAASLLVSKLPGPIKPETDRPGVSDLASDRGPVLRALARIGDPAVPFLAVRSNDADPVVRAWTTQLLGEIPSADSAQAVARRVIDAQPEVRRAALEAGRLLQSSDEARSVLRDKVLLLAEDTAARIDSRVLAIEAIANFRDGRAVPRLIRLAATRDEAGHSAQWALGVLTRQAFGRDTAAWDAWWKEHGSAHRVEWLIDSLMHDDPEVRRAAGEELKAITKEYFGYYDDLAKFERSKAQGRYRQWWEATGKARFSRG
jgi:hypothetical protein